MARVYSKEWKSSMFKKGYTPWNKGKKMSVETKRKLSEAMMGHPSYITQTGIEKMIETKRKNPPLGAWKGRKRPPFSKEWRDNISNSHKGAKSSLWRGGISRGYKTGYGSREYKEWREAVFKRDNYTCQDCGISGVYITAHHINSWANYKELRFEVSNGKTLCEDCHKLTDNYKGRNNKNNKTKTL